MASLVSLTPRKPLNSHFSNVPKLSRRGRGQAVRFDAARQLVSPRFCYKRDYENAHPPDRLCGSGRWYDVHAAADSEILEDQEGGRPLASVGHSLFCKQHIVVDIRS